MKTLPDALTENAVPKVTAHCKKCGQYGRLTLGGGAAAGAASQQSGTFPFTSGYRAVLFAAYESPLAWDRVGTVVDHLGGTSEIGSIYVGLTLAASPEATLSAGGFSPTTAARSTTGSGPRSP